MADKVVVAALRARYSVVELEAALDGLLEDVLSGVAVTSVTMDGAGGAGVRLGGNPREMLANVQTALDEENGDTITAPAGMGAHINFSTRRTET